MKQMDLNNILSLIAATIFADKRIYVSEVETFMTSTSKLQVARHLDPKLSEARLLAWYEMNKDNIREKITTPYFKDWYYDLLERLKDVPGKTSILDVMRKISKADNEVHVSERALITLAERYWGLR